MNSDNRYNVLRIIASFLTAPLITSVLYTWISWGYVFSPYLIIVLLCAYFILVVVFLPISLILFYKRWFNLYSSAAISFIVLFFIFLLLNLISSSRYTELTVSGLTLVKNGQITNLGYWRAVYGAFIVGLMGGVASCIFCAIMRGKKIFSTSYYSKL